MYIFYPCAHCAMLPQTFDWRVLIIISIPHNMQGSAIKFASRGNLQGCFISNIRKITHGICLNRDLSKVQGTEKCDSLHEQEQKFPL